MCRGMGPGFEPSYKDSCPCRSHDNHLTLRPYLILFYTAGVVWEPGAFRLLIPSKITDLPFGPADLRCSK